ncbi:hypothetical protein L6164_015566 [Bauhinia variegata]|uniref:Uncharacterized protein n=1 Tax=Bauhinia variegata TaxID=167791 RepID=A0ACB9NM21_BAUVA|nr:hypothetical protein L6164_015566 [Bauhinia variegata]
MRNDYIGAQADINVWNPAVDLPDDFSTAQIWLKNGDGPIFETVESGWTVNPKLYHDKATRFFVYWTGDSYKSTGCFDLTCSGFVQTSKQVVLGGTINPVSSPSGDQYHLTVGLFLDKNSSNWLLKVGPNNNATAVIGYWPGQLFKYLSHSARVVQWGGEVYSTQIRTYPHTATAMGSGYYASGLYGNACYMHYVRIMDDSPSFKYPEFATAWSDDPTCYSALNTIKGSGDEPVFYFGGPGRYLPYCP